MNSKWIPTGVVASVVLLGAITMSCGNKADEEAGVVRIGSKMISMPSFEAFRRMQRMYPTRMPEVFPGNRTPITFMVETQLLYDKASPLLGSHKALETRDWSWKQKFFPAHLYLSEVLEPTLGVTDEEIERYYEENTEEFRDTVTKFETKKVPAAEGDTTADTTGMKDSTVAQDSAYIQPLSQVRNEVIERAFLEKHPPTEEFVEEQRAEDSTVSESVIERMWINTARRNLPDFFMEVLYEEQYGEQFPDSVDVWYGEGKLITPDDMDVIMSWLPDNQREMYQGDPQRMNDLAKWLLIWELLSDEAEDSGFMENYEPGKVMDWARKVQVAIHHVENQVVEKAREGKSVDTTMAKYAYWDGIYRVQLPVDSSRLASVLQDRWNDIVALGVDSIIHSVRQDANVEFLQSDWKDERDMNPQQMLAQADSARDTGGVKIAEELYRSVATNFAFLPEGERAVGELAKILTENERYNDAIRHYRRKLLWYPQSDEEMCNTFFMIGFIYDEYLGKAELAEQNYKWLLKNTPDCELADDAEFMALHLNEPMSSVEELRGEAARQGRDIEDEPVELEEIEEEVEG